MPGITQPDDLNVRINALAKRIEDLERPSRVPGRQSVFSRSIFSYYGALAVTTLGDSPPDELDFGGQLLVAVARLATAGTTNTVFTVYKNGVSIGTITLGNGVTRQPAYLGNHRFAAEADTIQVITTTAGAGAKGATVIGRFRT